MPSQSRFERGRRRQIALAGSNPTRTRVYGELDDIAPDLSRLATEFAYGDIHVRPGLDAGQRELVILAVLSALGDTAPQIRAHVRSALGAGVGRQAVVETVLQTVPYAGFPRAINAMLAVKAALGDQAGDPTSTVSSDPPLPSGERMSATSSGFDAATQVCTRFFTSIDDRDWAQFESCLAPTVVTDFTALWGGEPEQHQATELATAWARLFAGFTATQHQVTGYLPADGTTEHDVTLAAMFQATHHGDDPFGSATWTLYGTYRIGLDHVDGAGPRIAHLHQTPQFGTGNRNIVLRAVTTSTNR